MKQIGPGKARKLSELPDGSQTNAVFSSDGRRSPPSSRPTSEQLSCDHVANGRSRARGRLRRNRRRHGTTTIGPVITWQPGR